MMAWIIKRTGKWVEWTFKKGRSRRKASQSSPTNTNPTSSQGATPSVTITETQGPAMPMEGGDQPLDKNIPIAQNFQGGPLSVIGSQSTTREKKERGVKG